MTYFKLPTWCHWMWSWEGGAQNLLPQACGNQLQHCECLGGLPRNRSQNRISSRDLLGETSVKDKEKGSRKRQGEESDWNKKLTAVKERGKAGLVKKSLRLQCSSKKGLSRPKASVGAKVSCWSGPEFRRKRPTLAQMWWWSQTGGRWAASQLHSTQQEIWPLYFHDLHTWQYSFVPPPWRWVGWLLNQCLLYTYFSHLTFHKLDAQPWLSWLVWKLDWPF